MLPHVTVLFKNNIYIIILKSTVTCGNMLKKGALSGKIDGNMYGNMSVTCCIRTVEGISLSACSVAIMFC